MSEVISIPGRIVMFPAVEMLEGTRTLKLAMPPMQTRSGYWARNFLRYVLILFLRYARSTRS